MHLLEGIAGGISASSHSSSLSVAEIRLFSIIISLVLLDIRLMRLRLQFVSKVSDQLLNRFLQ